MCDYLRETNEVKNSWVRNIATVRKDETSISCFLLVKRKRKHELADNNNKKIIISWAEFYKNLNPTRYSFPI